MSVHLSAAQIKARLDHPIIDADGHWIEYGPVFTEELRRVGGEDAVEGWNAVRNGTRSALSMSVEERRRRRISQEAFWGHPSKNTKDLATALFPRLLAERLDEIGLDFAIIYPTGGLRVPRVGADKPRRAAARAYNIVTAEYFRPFADRMTPAAIIPMHSPEEAIEELEFAVKQLGYKVAMLGSLMDRPVAAAGDVEGEAKRFAVWKDVIGLDSEYDYDPVWAKCLELNIAPSFHSGARRSGLRLSPSNFVYNHIGHFAAANHAACKAMFLGGVTRRFPGLNMAFLEGGAGWACLLYGDLLGHWEKRSLKGLEEVDPRNIDSAMLLDLAEKYGGEAFTAALKRQGGQFFPGEEKLTGGIVNLDDYSACKISQKQDWRDLFVMPFYFGCEADDPSNVWAFNTRANPLGARLNAIFSSDIGHFDVPDMTEVVPEAYEMVEDGLASAADFRDFTFANVVRLFGRQNPRFFAGTRVTAAAEAVLREAAAPTRAARRIKPTRYEAVRRSQRGLRVTGSGRNIGRATVLKLAGEGAHVVVNARANQQEAESVAREARDLGVKAVPILADVGKKAEVESLAARALSEFGRVDILINNAAIRPHKPFTESTDADWELIRSVVLDGPLHLTRALIEPMVENRYGRILFFCGDGSISASGSGRTHLSAAKMGLIGMARGLASEFAPHNIRVNVVSPGSIDTRRDHPEWYHGRLPNAVGIPLGRQGTVDEIAATCLFLVSEDGGFITGQTIHVNGGAHYY